jgi:polysaccharide pyruvyl transferase WcaK-like protein
MSRQSLPSTDAKVGLFGYLGSGNLGNDASTDAVLNGLRAWYDDDAIVCICREPAAAEERFGINAVSMLGSSSAPVGSGLAVLTRASQRLMDPIRLFRVVRRLDAVIVPGMGVFEEQLGVRPWGLPYTLFSLALCCRLTGTRLVFIGAGAEPAKNRLTRGLFAWAARLASNCSYRDHYSQQAMISNGSRRSAAVIPDVAIGLPAPAQTEPPRPMVALGVMAYFGPEDDPIRYQDVHQQYVDKLVTLVGLIQQRGRSVRLVIGDRADEQVAETVVARSTTGDRAQPTIEICRSTTQRELEDNLSECELVIASRYHTLVGAVRLGVPVISIGYGAKCDSLMADVGLERVSRHIEAWDCDWLMSGWDSIDSTRSAVIADLAAYNDTARAQLDVAYGDLRVLLGAAGSPRLDRRAVDSDA